MPSKDAAAGAICAPSCVLREPSCDARRSQQQQLDHASSASYNRTFVRYSRVATLSPTADAAAAAAATDSRFDRRLARILAHASDVFCEKGYEGASLRDLSRATGMS